MDCVEEEGIRITAMDCSEEEAIRAKLTAETNFLAMDFQAAKKFALKARKLNPNLEGISQLIATLKVHLSSTSLVNGERDWYSILGIPPSSDDHIIKKRYHKMTHTLHPDYNKSVGAETAFKLVSEAWIVLSDREKRIAYDKKRTQNHNPNPTPNPNSTFWTSCKLCRMQYEYLRTYLNLTLLCPNCHEPFLAEEISLSSNYIQSAIPWNTETRHENTKSVKKKVKEERDSREKKEQSKPVKRRNVDFVMDIRPMLMKIAKSTLNQKLEEWNFNKKILKNEVRKPGSVSVPDSEFHDFDFDRSESCFGADQVWATYDDEDRMPRLYVMVQKVNSFKPFNVQLSFLNSKSTSEFGAANWIESGFRKTCGSFRVGRYEARDSINIFSHKVNWKKGQRGAVKILPQKGQVWAIYRNWSPDWSALTPDETLYKYDMVEVVEGYTEEEGVKVCHLEKVNGFRTVFRPGINRSPISHIPREEIFRMSHQIPYYVISGREKENAPAGCYELDPASTPLDVSTEISESWRENGKPQEELIDS